MIKNKRLISGILLCFAIAVPSWLLGRTLPIIGGPVFGILLGMLIASVNPGLPTKAGEGVRFTSKKLLQYSIILLGFEMNIYHVYKVGSQSILIILSTMSASFIVAFIVGRLLRINGDMTILIGVGTSICGGSAIAATAPVIGAEDKSIAQAISTIFLFNIIAVFIFPPLGRSLGMSDSGFGMWAGTAINDTSSVVAAGTAWSAVAGENTALAYATIVKLTRTLMIVPVTLALAIHTWRKGKQFTGIPITGDNKGTDAVVNNTSVKAGASPVDISTNIHEAKKFRFTQVFPWFVIGFIASALISTFSGMPVAASSAFVSVGKFMIVMAMAAIGLNTNIRKLITTGLKPIFLGLCCWFSVAAVSLLAQVALKLW